MNNDNRQKLIDGIPDKVSIKRILELHPVVQNIFLVFFHEAYHTHGIVLRMTGGYRTPEKQHEMYIRPHDGIDNDFDGIIDNEKKITSVDAWHSFHNWKLAGDVVEMKDGKPMWSNPNWLLIGELGEKLGLEWGGRFISSRMKLGKTAIQIENARKAGKGWDKPHFQYPHFGTCKELIKMNFQGMYYPFK